MKISMFHTLRRTVISVYRNCSVLQKSVYRNCGNELEFKYSATVAEMYPPTGGNASASPLSRRHVHALLERGVKNCPFPP